MPGIRHEYRSQKSRSTFIALQDGNASYLVVEGEAAVIREVLKKVEEIRTKKYEFSTVDWMARQMSHTF